MAERFTTRIKTSLNKTLPPVQTIDGIFVVGDNKANEIVVELYKDGNKVALNPSRTVNNITGQVLLDDETTMYVIPGSVNSSGEAVVLIPADSRMTDGTTVTVSVLLEAEPTGASSGVGTGWQLTETIACFRCVVKGTTGSNIVIPSFPVNNASQLAAYIETLKQEISIVASQETTRQENESTRQRQEGVRQDNEADRITLYNKFNNLTVDAHSVAYGATPTAEISERPNQNPNRKHIEFGLVPGVGVSDMHLTEDYKLYVGYSNGTNYTTPATLQGPRGETAYGMVVESYEESDRLLTLNNTANNSHIFEDDAISYEYIDDLFRTL